MIKQMVRKRREEFDEIVDKVKEVIPDRDRITSNDAVNEIAVIEKRIDCPICALRMWVTDELNKLEEFSREKHRTDFIFFQKDIDGDKEVIEAGFTTLLSRFEMCEKCFGDLEADVGENFEQSTHSHRFIKKCETEIHEGRFVDSNLE